MSRFNAFKDRLDALEKSEGWIVLDDGSRFKPQHSGIRLLRSHCIVQQRLNGEREPTLADFSDEEQEQLKHYARWHPDASEHGALSVMVSDIARQLLS